VRTGRVELWLFSARAGAAVCFQPMKRTCRGCVESDGALAEWRPMMAAGCGSFSQRPSGETEFIVFATLLYPRWQFDFAPRQNDRLNGPGLGAAALDARTVQDHVTSGWAHRVRRFFSDGQALKHSQTDPNCILELAPQESF